MKSYFNSASFNSASFNSASVLHAYLQPFYNGWKREHIFHSSVTWTSLTWRGTLWTQDPLSTTVLHCPLWTAPLSSGLESSKAQVAPLFQSQRPPLPFSLPWLFKSKKDTADRSRVHIPHAPNQRHLPDKTLKSVSGPSGLGHSQPGWPDHLIYYCHNNPCFVILHVLILTGRKILNKLDPFGTFIWQIFIVIVFT